MSKSIPASDSTLSYRRTKNIRAVQLLLGHTKLESTVRYLGIEVDDALEIAEQKYKFLIAGRNPAGFFRPKADAQMYQYRRAQTPIQEYARNKI
jgi:hypothetical protein